ncbi:MULTISPECIES: hypothetical protein [unclassified Bradyrhizobium]|uniref:hypothetical protein n=1 Tax=unclassified Bradyrhizobium TaxID=2631580 RepID=UPI002915E5DA|nr:MULTISPECIES: hypothetical protein [unclassified Bradyrhizobium]
MIPPGKTTLSRMQRAAMIEAERIEISQDARVLAGLLKAPMPDQVGLRDDFAGIVRLIDAIESDTRLKDALADRLERLRQAKATPAPPVAAELEVDAE